MSLAKRCVCLSIHGPFSMQTAPLGAVESLQSAELMDCVLAISLPQPLETWQAQHAKDSSCSPNIRAPYRLHRLYCAIRS